MRYFQPLLGSVIGLVILAAGCGNSPANNAVNSGKTNTANTANATNAVNAPANADNAVATTAKPEAATENNAPTITPVVNTYYDALKRKDDAALQSVLSAAFIKSVQDDMKAEKKTGMAAYLALYDTIPEKPVEVRNEKIEGDKAVAELKGGAYIKWTAFSFIKENGAWKFTGGSPEIDSVKQGSTTGK
ncbi:MAG: hypothetical protein IPJ55_18325 [Chloracidobacterium sp.]|nr:hypothetical protein [Chloracidobacterium sp.]